MATTGKRYEKWEFKAKDGSPFTVDIKIADTRKGPRYSGVHPKEASGVYFRVDIDDFDLHEWATDPEKLKEKVAPLLKDSIGLEWQPFLYVQVSGSTDILRTLEPQFIKDTEEVLADCKWHHKKPPKAIAALSKDELCANESVEFKVQIMVDSYLLATRKSDGKKYHRKFYDYRRYGNDSWTKAQEGWPEVGLSDQGYHDHPIQALITDTPEARAAINRISKNLQGSIDVLKEMLSPEKAEASILALGAGQLLLEAKGETSG